jgi:D-alanyl-lipoteichoic acid acyltransferase DltB (MBOAT superfamily)
VTFTTLTYLLFLPAVFALYWSLRDRWRQNVLIVAASYFFYGWWDVRFCSLLLFSSLVDYLVGLGLGRASRTRPRRLLLAASLTTNLGVLAFFKYFDFFSQSFAAGAARLGWTVDAFTTNVVLPVGISFYTFQTLSYTLDIYWRRIRPTNRLFDYLAYVSFFPQLVAGPIERAAEMLPQFERQRRFDYAEAVDGCKLILWGFFKKLVVADQISPVVDLVYGSMSTASGSQAALATFCFTIQIYADFSAYSDIATGTARLFGFRLMRNFAYPYFSESLSEFWRRWHISLSTWFRDYVYIPLGGSRRGKARIVVAILVTFVLSGLWHGAAGHFVAWGAFMGAALAVEVSCVGRSAKSASSTPLPIDGLMPGLASVGRTAATFAIVCLGFTFFRAESVADAALALGKMASAILNPATSGTLWDEPFSEAGGNAFLVTIVMLSAEWMQRQHPHPLVLRGAARWQRWTVYTVLLWTILYAGPKETEPFIYFQF